MGNETTLTIDGRSVTVPAGTVIVDAAKKLDIHIPVFCYHPKLRPAGMCRVCLVEVGRPLQDRASGKAVFEDDGTPKIAFSGKLLTACTEPVSPGMVVNTTSERVLEERRGILEFLLTSHPLDCPVCDKGGECPLQNLTLEHGSGESRFRLEDKKHLDKHVALGDLIWLDRERCIQCGRCVRFQQEIPNDPVIGFYNRGRSFEIRTYSEPGFDSIFSGNTTDICPVGALTSADFRFGARPWELNASASICEHCPVGCNITYNTRREAASGGRTVIKRVMPRQNEAVNELWLCDRGRFAHHYNESSERLMKPLVRKDGQLQESTWDEALDKVAEAMRAAGPGLISLTGGRLSNEDIFNIREMTAHAGGKPLLYSTMGGGESVALLGGGAQANLGSLGAGDVVLVAACDLHQEAPIWWLRIKQAADRGAAIITVNCRPTRLDDHAAHALRCAPGEALTMLAQLKAPEWSKAPENISAAAAALAEANNLVVVYGSDGIGLAESTALAHDCAELAASASGSNSTLLAAWPEANTQGAFELGLQPANDLAARLSGAQVAYIAGADPAGDSPVLAAALKATRFVVVQDLFLTETAALADVVLPTAAHSEREGSFTSGERRAQRFYPAVTPFPGPRADFAVAAQLAQLMGQERRLEARSAALVFKQLVEQTAAFDGLSYEALAAVEEQWPPAGCFDLHYAGTAYANNHGSGVKLGRAFEGDASRLPSAPGRTAGLELTEGALYGLPVKRLYDDSVLMRSADLLDDRRAGAEMWVSAETAARMKLAAGESTQVEINEKEVTLVVKVDAGAPEGAALLPRHSGLPLPAGGGPVVVKRNL
jgi:NADH-quinone oxidoreductase subunit G